jgi:hypothetical protein
MPRKPKEVEENLEIQSPKKQTFATRWFNNVAVNNRKELKIICDITSRSAEEQFSMYLKSGNTEVYAVIFDATMETIKEFLRGKQKTYKRFTFEIANSLNIGYDNNDDEENEKVGNFMPIIEHINTNRKIVDDDTMIDENKTNQNFIRWKELNVKKNIEYLKEIQEKAYERLKTDYHTNVRTSEAIIPLFCIFMDNVCHVLKMKYKEAQGTDVSEVSINVLGWFDAFYSFNEQEDTEIVEFEPNIKFKLGTKNDDQAGD